ncbi:MAG TPA: hypothetical protein VGL76_04385 [Gaiellaceae bacterium]
MLSTRLFRLALLATLVLVVFPAAAVKAAPRMQIGFYDDPSFRWASRSAVIANLKAASSAHATIIHVLADWSQIAQKRPKNALTGNDPAYNLTDLDALVSAAPHYGLQVYVTISNTPSWANGGKTVNHPPTHLSDLTNVAHMLSARYNGRHGHGIVTRWSIWNEPNLQLFLTPQFNAKGKIVSAAEYAKLYAAGYAGIKAGNPGAQVAIGETSNRGHNHPTEPSSSNSVAPATFAHLVAVANPHLKFDAYAEHPYPTIGAKLGPDQKVAYPNVSLMNLGKFAASLKQWFHRTVPLWLTEWGEQTRPQISFGISYAQQAKDAKEALALAAKVPDVQMFIWFILRDSTGKTWFSGLESASGAKKPSYAAFTSSAKKLTGQTQAVSDKARSFAVHATVPYLSYFDPIGSKVFVEYSLLQPNGRTQVTHGAKRNVPLAANQTVPCTVKLPTKYRLLKGLDYTLQVTVVDKHGNTTKENFTISGS